MTRSVYTLPAMQSLPPAESMMGRLRVRHTPVVDDEPRFEKLEPFVERALELLLAETSLRLVNVNVPQDPRGVAWTRVSVRQYDG